MSGGRFLVWLLTLLLAVASGIQVALSARRLHAALEAAQQSQDEALAMQSRLLIERAALAAYQNVEQTAQGTLKMQFPQAVTRVTR
jgi:cell division protein FtsL